jgi:hypothetical protein
MSMQSGSAAMTGKPLIESDRVERTTGLIAMAGRRSQGHGERS